ncbi:endonuclease/exonuclease/phosphatase family protein [Brachybacterium hainanense]|uniref:Endonuclease/exonuclease/phosphatase family protein n=1 Tax=Brachybacterium hainanense TaxID=1541174 RepID=A0ABV6RB13_9MICO
MRVVSWNVRGMRDDLRALIDTVRDLEPDLLLLQEAPQVIVPTARLRWLARRMGLEVLVGGRLCRGLAILASAETAGQVIRRGLTPVPQRLTDANSVFPRGIAAVRLSVPGGGELVVANLHLALDEEHRAIHVGRALELVGRAGAPVIIGGDLNERPEAPAFRALTRVLADPAAAAAEPTFPARRPSARIDALLTTPGMAVRRSEVVTCTAGVSAARLAGATDHLPVLLDVSLRPASRGA